jgi:hypothetical protein
VRTGEGKLASLTPKEKDRIMNELLAKLKEERLQKNEGEQLRKILEEKKDEAFNIGDVALAMGIVFLLAGLIGYLAEKY